MRAEFQPRHGDIRVFAEDHRYGDPYVWCSSMQIFSDGKSCEIGPYVGKLPLSAFKAMVVMCRELGIERVLAITYPTGAEGGRREKWITIPIRPTKIQQFYDQTFSEGS